MISWGESQTVCQDLSSDTTASSLIQFKLYMNIGYKFTLAQLGRPVIEKNSNFSDSSLTTVLPDAY